MHLIGSCLLLKKSFIIQSESEERAVLSVPNSVTFYVDVFTVSLKVRPDIFSPT